jgi:hypothetical protein
MINFLIDIHRASVDSNPFVGPSTNWKYSKFFVEITQIFEN